MKIVFSLQRTIKVDDKIYLLDIDSSTEKISCNQESRSMTFESLICLDPLLLSKVRVNSERIEESRCKIVC